MDTMATIPTGAMAERWKWGSFVIWGLFCGAIYYPLFAAWTWGGGWLSKTWDSFGFGAGYVDFAGSGVVHAVGGAAALAGALVLGPRIGKYDADGNPERSPATTSRWRCSARSSCCSAGSASTPRQRSPPRTCSSPRSPRTPPSPARSAPSWQCSVANWRMGKPDPGMMANGMLAGLVAITAPCAFVVAGDGGGDRRSRRRSSSSIAIGFIERRWCRRSSGCHLRARDLRHVRRAVLSGCSPTAATAGGGTAPRSTGVKGLFWGDAGQFAAQLLGAVVIWTVIFGVAFAFFRIQDTISKAMGKGGIRSQGGPTSSPGWTCRRWASSPTRSSSAATSP